MAIPALVIFGLPAALLFILGSKKSAPAQPGKPGEGWGAPAPGIAPGSPVELRTAADGKQYVYFTQAVAAQCLQALSQCYLVGNIQKPSPELAFYDVVPIAQYGATPGMQNASLLVQQAVASGMIVEGSATLPYPASNAGRQVAIGALSGRRLCDPQYQMPYAILGDPQPSTPVSGGYQPGSTAPPIPNLPGYQPGTTAPPVPPGGQIEPPGDIIRPPSPAQPQWDAGIPQSVRSRVEAMLADPSMDPIALDAAAAELEPSYPIAAQKLRAKAAELRLAHHLDDQQRGGTPFQIRSGDTGYYLANYYTGDPNKWREIPSANPGMRIVTQNGVSQLVPWQGTILLPLAWNCRTKPLPKLQGGGTRPTVPWEPGAPGGPTTGPQPPPDPEAVQQAVYDAAQAAIAKAQSIFI